MVERERPQVGIDWRVEHADLLVDKMHAAGLVVGRTAVHTMVAERVSDMSREMGLSASTGREYCTDEAIYELTASILGAVALGEIRMQIEPTTTVAPRSLGRAVAGLADAIVFYQTCPRCAGRADRILDLAVDLSLLGASLADSPTRPTVTVSRGLLTRIARQLDAVAGHPEVSAIQASEWRRVAMGLQVYTNR